LLRAIGDGQHTVIVWCNTMETAAALRLPPCPYCWSHEAERGMAWTAGTSLKGPTGGTFHWIECKACGCRTRLKQSPAEALESWSQIPADFSDGSEHGLRHS
jgi:hypothetical protein